METPRPNSPHLPAHTRSISNSVVFWVMCSALLLLLQHSRKTTLFDNLFKAVQEDLGHNRPTGPSRRVLVRWAKSATRLPGARKTGGAFNALVSNTKVIQAKIRVAIIRRNYYELFRTPASSNLHMVAEAVLGELSVASPAVVNGNVGYTAGLCTSNDPAGEGSPPLPPCIPEPTKGKNAVFF